MDAKDGIMCNLKGQMDKGGHYVEMTGWMQKGAIYDVQIKRADG